MLRPALDFCERLTAARSITVAVRCAAHTLEEVRGWLAMGVAQVYLNAALLNRPALLSESVAAFGSSHIGLAIDARRLASSHHAPRWQAFAEDGFTPVGSDAVAWAVRAAGLGAGMLLLNSLDAPSPCGTTELELVRLVSQAVSIPVMAGANTNAADLADLLREGKAQAVLIDSATGQASIHELKDQLKQMGILLV
jgi:cyclase